MSNSIYDVYVMNSSSSSGLLCASLSDFYGGNKKVNITCDRNPTFLGDQIAIVRRVDIGTLQVYELKVYRKLKQRKNKLSGFLTICFLDPLECVQRMIWVRDPPY